MGRHWADFQYEIYLNGMTGAVPRLPTDLTRLEELTEQRLGPGPVGYVAGSAGNGSTARANRAALERRRIVPRMLRDVVFVDANVPVDGESFLSGWPSDHVRRTIDAQGGYWPPLGPEDYAGQGLTDEQIARIVGASPHPGVTLTEPAVLSRPLGELPATYVKCLLDGDQPMPAVAALLGSDSWELVELDTGHWPMFSQPGALARVLHEAAIRP